MATTSITDLAYVPEVFNEYVVAQVAKKSAFFRSGAVVQSDLLVPLYGDKVVVPAWDGLTGTANVLSDASCQTPSALTSTKQLGAILERGKVWSVNGLASSFAGSNPLDAVGGQVSDFWARDIDAALVSSAIGAVNALGTGVLNDISGGAGNAAIISASSIIQTRALAGEFMNDFNMLVVHPDVYALLVAQNLTQMIPNSQGQFIETYMGMEIIVSSTLAPASGVYNTLIVRSGAFGYAENTDPAKVLEFDRDIKCNDDLMSVQKRYVIHPMAASFTGTPAGATASNAELATTGNWALGAASKLQFGVRALRHKIA